MPSSVDKERFNIPVLDFLVGLLQESYPDVNVAEGSAVHDLLVRPAALLLQPQRDHTRLMLRNLKLRNFQVMDEAEMDALAGNFLVTRRSGARARGVQRVIFAAPRAVQIGTGVRFLDEAGRLFSPAVPAAFTQSDVAANVLPASGEYYVDVSVVAEQDGEDYMATAGAVTRVQGVPGAVRTTNTQAFTAGRNRDSNTELYARTLGAIVNRDLVKRGSLSQAVLAEFTSVRQVEVAGFGDELQRRDIVEAIVGAQELFPVSFGTKVNLPLNELGVVQFLEADDVTVIQTPLGGFVGALVDNLDVDFRALSVQLGDPTARLVAVQPGFLVRLFGSAVDDPDIGDFVVRQVVESPITPGGVTRRVLLLDRPFASVTPEDADIERDPYTLVGAVATSSFHVGGKVDLFVDSSANVERTVTIATVLTDEAGVAEIPLTAVAALPSGAPLFESGVGFEQPVVAILQVEELDFASDVVVRTLTPGTHYVTVRQENRGRFSRVEHDTLVIRGRDLNDVPLFNGARLRVRYLMNADYAAIQTWLTTDERRDLTKDVLVRPPQTLLLDVDLAYRGAVSAADVRSIIAEFVAEKSFGSELTVNELLTTLAFFGVTDVVLPVTLSSFFDLGTGAVSAVTSQDRVAAGRAQVFRLTPTPAIRKLG